MATPRKVKDKAALADRLIAQSAKTTTVDPAPAPTVPPPALSVVTDTPAPVAPQQAGNPYAIDPTAANPAPAVPATDDWKHKYSVLQGMFDKSRLDSGNRITQLENQIGVLTTMATPKPDPTYQETFHPAVAPAAPVDYGFTDEQIEEMGGQEFVDNIGKISAAGAANEIASLRNELGTLKNTQTETLDDLFYNRLSELCPTWRAINADERFNTWLAESDGLSGIARSNFLTNAYDTRDADTASRYFNQFAAIATPSPHNLNPANEIDLIPELAGGSGPTGGQGAKAIYTPATIQQFFKDKGLGKWKGKEAEADAIELDIFAAQKEGRIMLTGGRKSA